MVTHGKMSGAAAMALESTAERFVLGSSSTEGDHSLEKIADRPLLPYVALALGVILLGAGFSLGAAIAFALYIILRATSFDKTSKQNTLPPDLTSTNLDE
jgi:hypothetical protein